HPQEADLSLVQEGLELGNGVMLFERGARRAGVELHEVDVVRSHPAQALLDAGPDVVAGEDVLARARAACGRLPDGAAALAREEVLLATPRNRPTDVLL